MWDRIDLEEYSVITPWCAPISKKVAVPSHTADIDLQTDEPLLLGENVLEYVYDWQRLLVVSFDGTFSG